MYSSPSVYRFAQSIIQLRSVQNFLRPALASFAALVLGGFFVAGAKAATYTVTTVNDGGAGSFRQAITNANQNPGADTIVFNISAGNGVRTITVLSALPAIASDITIDATTQPGYPAVNTPQVEIVGSNLSNGEHGLHFRLGTSILKGLAIRNFPGDGIRIGCDYPQPQPCGIPGAPPCPANPCNTPELRPAVTIRSSHIGTNAAGTLDIGNNGSGIYIEDSTRSCTIGGNVSAPRNVISGNNNHGIFIEFLSPTHIIQGNYIGTNLSGTAGVGNTLWGISDEGAAQIGGTSDAARNVISGNGVGGVESEGVITGNYIGTNAAGTAAIPNGSGGGILCNPCKVGGSAPGAGNVISGNNGNGIRGKGTFQGNRIGTNAAGTAAVPNKLHGIYIESDNSTIGGTGTSSVANIISGNLKAGIHLEFNFLSGTNPTLIKGNYIGTNPAGADLGNGESGVDVGLGAVNVQIGGAEPFAANAIAFNGGDGVTVRNDSNDFQSQPLGVDIHRNIIRANDELGIDLNADGLTQNETLDGDTGANDLQNFPVITSAATFNGIHGTLNSTPNKTFRIDFYSNAACDSSGNGEGAEFIGSTDVTTDANGNAAFQYAGGVSAGQIITATATLPFQPAGQGNNTGGTSEFSPCLAATASHGQFKFSAANYTVNENTSSVTISVNRIFGSQGYVSVGYSTSDGTATAGQDYTTTFGILAWADGDTTSKTFQIPITDDGFDEPNKTVNLILDNPNGGATFSNPSSAVLTITDDDAPPQIFVDDISLGESDDNSAVATFTVRLGAHTEQVSVLYETTNDFAISGIDYQATSGTLHFAAGETSKTITVPLVGDNIGEPHETFFLNLSAPTNATIGDAQASALILNDDEDGMNPVALLPAADAYVKGATPTDNFGAVAELQVKRTLNPGSGKGRQAYLRFDTSSITGSFTKATLRVFGRLSAITATNHDIPTAAFPVSAVWTESLLTWANKPAPNVPQPLAQAIVTDDTERWCEFDITDFINDERIAGRAVTGVLLRNMAQGEIGDFYTVFRARETTLNQPQLVIAP